MTNRAIRASFFACILTIATFASAGAGGAAELAPAFRETAIRHVSQTEGIPEALLTVAHEATTSLPLTGKALWSGKVVTGGGDVFPVVLDASGRVVADRGASHLAEERAAWLARHGRVEPELMEKLASMAPGERVGALIWLTATPQILAAHALPRPSTEEELAARDAVLAAAYSAAQAPLVAELSAAGGHVKLVSKLAPLVAADLPASVLLALRDRPEVDMVYLERTHQAEMYSAARTEKVDVVWGRGYTGSNVKVAVVEDDGIEFANTYLADGTYYNSVNKNVGSHATYVAGVIASTDATHKGVAYGAPALLSANSQTYSDSNVIAASEWAYNNGVNVLSNSWGSDTNLAMNAMDRYLDHFVYQHYRTVVKSAGNNAPGYGTGTGHVTSPGLGWNTLTVGAIDDANTTGWTDDVMAPYSSYKNPVSTNGDRQKPEVVAVGSKLMSTITRSPWIGWYGEGTSFAAPQVSGLAALLMSRDATLKLWPEQVRALIIASAHHNIEGAGALSDKDGAGAIDASVADDSLRLGRTARWSLTSADYPKTATFSATAGQKVRVAINWDSHTDTNHPPTSDNLVSDLDLAVLAPNGATVGGSYSWDNNYEVVEFTASATGTYTARVTAPTVGGTEAVGFAYALI